MIRWAILGLGNISQRFIEGLSFSETGYLYAVASYTQTKRNQFESHHKDIVIYDNYDSVFNDESVDAVYIATRHCDHFRLSKQAMLHHKSVLCEKPACLTYKESLELCRISAEKHVFYMEAMKTRFIPAVNQLKRLIDSNELGDILRVETSFCNQVEYDAHSYLYDVVQGGAFYDLASYNIASILDYMSFDSYEASFDQEFEHGVDAYTRIELAIKGSRSAVIEVGIDREKSRDLLIVGSKGTARANPFYRPTQVCVEWLDGRQTMIDEPYVNDDFFGEIEEANKCIKKHKIESERLSHNDMLACMKLFDELNKTRKMK